MLKTKLCAAGLAGLVAGSLLGDLSWPQDFAAQVAAREAAVQPAAVPGSAEGLELFGGARQAAPAFGSEARPFDSWTFFSLTSLALPFCTEMPGCLLLLR